jgi:hypothetical protein
MFDLFPRLPAELRIRVWELAAFPRLVHLPLDQSQTPESRSPRGYVQSPTPCPSILHVCRESRQHARYQRAFLYGADIQYIWLNFDVDVVSVSFDDFINDTLKHFRSQIRRLRVAVDYDSSYDIFCYYAYDLLQDHTRLNELHIFVTDASLHIWLTVFENRNLGSFPAERVRYICPSTGLVFTGQQLIMSEDWQLWHSWGNGMGLREDQTVASAIAEMEDGDCMQLREMHQVG